MSNNPDVQVAFSGETPDISMTASRAGKSVSISAGRDTRNVSFTVERGGNMYAINVNTKENWATMTTYIPQKGEIDIYSNRTTIDEVDYPGIKIGDGTTYVVDLPFLGDDQTALIMGMITSHTGNSNIHVTAEEKAFWNNKLNYTLDPLQAETLVLNRN